MKGYTAVLLLVSATGWAQTTNTITGNVSGFGVGVGLEQIGTGHLLEFTLTGSHNILNTTQTGIGHSAVVTVTPHLGPSTVNLIQGGLTPQTVSIMQSCANPAGCTVTVQQGQ